MLVQASELLVEDYQSEITDIIHDASFRLSKEVSIQRSLSEHTESSYQPLWDEYTIGKIFNELKSFFANHPAANEKNINFSEKNISCIIKTDFCLLSRVLCNMIINALEATDKNGDVKVWADHEGNNISFCVWNSQQIPEDIACRIFQRNFSTKGQAGRGVGTYSMKLFGEKILGGEVGFVSLKENGTTFKYTTSVLMNS